MLDVHPIHKLPHGWKEFLLHIATISVGLLIAIGLEQTVELLHRHHERNRLQEELRSEGVHNREGIGATLSYLDAFQTWELAAAKTVQIAASHSNGPPALYPGPFQVDAALVRKLRFMVPSAAVWTTAKSSGTVALLPNMQALAYTRLDRFHDLVTNMDWEWRKAGAALVSLETRYSADPLKHNPDLATMSGPQLDQLDAALMSEYGITREYRILLQAFGEANDAVLEGIQDEDAMAAFMYRDLLTPASTAVQSH
jgi:hypothetical protein